MTENCAGLSIQFLKGVGPRKAVLLERLGIKTLHDAIYYLPVRYEDRRLVRKICDLVPGELQSVSGKVLAAELVDLARGGRKLFGSYRSGRTLFELTISDGSGILKAKWFNQPFMKGRFKAGQSVTLSGVVKPPRFGPHLEIDNPEYEHSDDDADTIHTARVVPIYRATEGITPRQLRPIISAALDACGDKLADPMPPDMIARLGLPGLAQSVRSAHFPPDDTPVGQLERWEAPFQRRLIFDELFMFEAGLARMRQSRVEEPGISFECEGRKVEALLRALPFELTRAQRRVFFEDIAADMKSSRPMHRLVQGDVGSGKTIVALMAALTAAECGWQAALMAPTEILAEQHYLNIKGIADHVGLRLCLLTGSTKAKPLDAIKNGEVDLVVGTHALIQEGVEFGRLGLAVIDEQHRFGVMQRAVLRQKGRRPDMLIMTATPIPRTLAMTLYGDLDYSVMDELPPGRSPVVTALITPDRKAAAYDAIRAEVASGGQVYVVYPMVDESESASLRNAVQGAEALEQMFPEARVGLIHGRLKPAEKESVMRGFKAGEIDILVSTTVIEVGVDVPNASLMLIVHAERFGLSQLHQLRGRVGRGSRGSRCMLLAYPPLSEDATARLDAMCSTTDGFRIAEYDLEIRGPGEFMGTRQSGVPELRVANVARDAALLSLARREAFALVDSDPMLEGYPLLRGALEGFWRDRVELFKTG